MSIELLIDDVEWCRHGHPILVLRERHGQRKVAIAVTTEDAQDLLAECSRGSGRFRACTLIGQLLETLDATIERVSLAVGDDNVLRAHLAIGTTRATRTLPTQATDGLVLAQQQRLSIWIEEADLARVSYRADHRADGCGPRRRAAAEETTPADLLAPYRDFVEALDFGDDPRNTDRPPLHER